MIPIGTVLLAVQHLQKGRGGVAPVIGAHLVHLVQQKQGIFGTGLGDGGHNPAGHGTHIGLPVAPDIRLVVDAAQRDPGQLPVQAPGDGVGHGGLAHTRRAYQADDLPGKLRGHLLHRQNLQNPLLHLLQAEVVVIQNLPGGLNVHPFLGGLVPGELQDGVQIVPEHGPLGGTEGLLLQAGHILQELFLRVLGQTKGLDFAPVGGGVLVLPFLTQLLPDDLHLLPEVILPLAPVNLPTGLLLHLRLQAQHLQLPAEKPQSFLQPGHRVQVPQEAGRILISDGAVLKDGVRDVAQIPGGQNAQLQLPGGLLHQLQVLVKEHGGLPHHGLSLGGELGGRPLLDGLHPGGHAGLGLEHPLDFGAVLPLHQNPGQVVLHPENLLDLRHGTHGVQLLFRGVVVDDVLLGHQEHPLVRQHGGLQGLEGFLPAHVKMKQLLGKHHQAPEGQDGHLLRYDNFTHGIVSLSGVGLCRCGEGWEWGAGEIDAGTVPPVTRR